MKSIVTLFLFVCCLSFSALTQKLNYDNNYNWYLGFNTGAAWQTTDIDNKTRLGWGFTLGKSFYMDYGRPISFDIRARYLRGYWEGIDSETTLGNTGNSTVDSIYGGGAIKRNFLSEQHRIALELVLHANNFRERTGWDPYVFFGLGITGHNAFGDYITYQDGGQFLEQAYDFSGNENTDRVYEFAMENGENSLYNDDRLQWDFMPSLGLGLGYFVTPSITLGLEHKTTFTLSDYYDGYAAGSNNDLHHYTNGYVRFYLRTKKKNLATNRPDNPDTPDPITSNPNPIRPDVSAPQRDPQPPVVDYTQPSNSPHTTQNSTYNLSATVKHVDNSENIIFRQNGVIKTDFIFNANTAAFTSTVNLVPGQNVFVIIGSNEDGDDAETMIINYERETQAPPVVTITQPASNPENVTVANYTITANVLNVSGKDQIELLVNGNKVSNFNYSSTSSGLSYSFTLKPGTNNVRVTGTNSVGSDSENATLIYRPGNTVQAPVVNFTNPNVSPFTLNNNTFNLTASVLNINNLSQLTFKQNGIANSNFSFTGTNFSSNVVLIPGQNVFELIGTNAAGKDNAITLLIYNRPAPKPPVVTITKPFVNPFTTSNNTANLTATLLNISNKNQITFTLNGNNYTNFNFNNQTGALNTNLALKEGSNVVVISGTNNDGSDSKETILIYKPTQTIEPPIVTFTDPASNPFYTEGSNSMVSASVFNVTSKNQIDVLLNGQPINNFVFNSVQKKVSLNTSLITGANIITITATNTAGVDSENQTIIRNEPEPRNPPVVTFIQPVSNPITVYNNNYSVTAKVEHVAGKPDISVKINGLTTTNFTYSSSNRTVNFSTGLISGANNIEITGTNAYGQDVASTTIIYKRQNVTLAPIVEITNPSATSSVSNQQSFLLEANILNISNANQISMTINGNSVGGFVFNSVSHILSYNGNLNNGLNTVIITATNSAGTASDNAFITYRPQEVIEPPLVSFIKPAGVGTTVNAPGYTIEAKVLHVNSKNGITLKFNGQTINPAYYNFNLANKTVTYASTVTLGNNIFQITGTNSAGTNSASTTIIYTLPVEDEPCDTPIGNIVLPATNGSTTENKLLAFKANVQHVANATEITMKVNGNSQSFSFNAALKQITKSILLNEGNNTIEIILETNCGKKRLTRSIIYKKAEEPCDAPLINPISPALASNTEMNNIALEAVFTHVQNGEQIRLTVNGQEATFNYDEAQHYLSANPELVLGLNKIILTAKTACGTKEVIWNVNRKPCNKPVINVAPKPSNNGVVTNPDFRIIGSISNLGKRERISVTQNGQAINFIYNTTSESFSTNTVLKKGLNTFIITATSACGKTIKSIKVQYKPVVVVKTPTVNITAPVNNSISTEANTYLVKAKTTNITANNQIAVSVNGSNVNFNFNPTAGIINFNQALSVGQNKIVITVVNAGGTASDNVLIVHTEPQQILAPVINIVTPNSNPHITDSNGRVLLSGTITNISAMNQVQILFNGTEYTSNTSTIANDIYTFSFHVPVSDAVPSTVVTIIASNPGGSDTENQTIQKQTSNSGVSSGGGTITIGGGGLGGGN